MLNFILKHKEKLPHDVINIINVVADMKKIMNKATQKNHKVKHVFKSNGSLDRPKINSKGSMELVMNLG